MDDTDELYIYIEIVSCRDLLIGDRTSSDPYVKVKTGDGKKDHHETKHILKTLNPNFDKKLHKSAFVLEYSEKDLYKDHGILFKIKDWDRVGSNDDLGYVRFYPEQVLELCSDDVGEAMDYTITVPKGRKELSAGSIQIVLKHASEEDLKQYAPTLAGRRTKGMKRISTAMSQKMQSMKVITEKVKDDIKDKVTSIPENVTKQVEKVTEKVASLREEDNDDQDQQDRDHDQLMQQQNISISSTSYSKEESAAIELSLELQRIQSLDDREPTTTTTTTNTTPKSAPTTTQPVKPPTTTTTPPVQPTTTSTNTATPSATPATQPTTATSKKTPATPASTPVSTTTETKSSNKNAKLKSLLVGSGTTGTITDTTDSDEDDAIKPPMNRTASTVLNIKQGEKIKMKITIQSCKNLLCGDRTSSDPYVKVKVGKEDIHETNHIMKTLNPVYTPETNSTFTLIRSVKELFQEGGLHFKIKDWDFLDTNDELGDVFVSAEALYDLATDPNKKDTETTMDFTIEPPKQKQNQNAGTIQITFGPSGTFCYSEDQDETVSNKKQPTTTAKDTKDTTTTTTTTSSTSPTKKSQIQTSDMGAMDPEEDDHNQEFPLLIQIVSCSELVIADKRVKSSDPYVKIMMGKKELHKTKHICKNLNPIFSAENNATYLLNVPSKDVYNNQGLTFLVKDWNMIGFNDELGTIRVPADKLFEANGNDMKFKLQPVKGSRFEKVDDVGYITINCRQATKKEQVSLQQRQQSSSLFTLPQVFKETKLPSYGEPDLSLLIEIVSCRGLLNKDLIASDPYVKVKLGKKDVHETKYISDTTSPIYTLKTDYLFILDVATKELVDNGGLTFKVKDFDLVGGLRKNDTLGSILVPPETLCNADGERLEFKLDPPPGETSKDNKPVDAGYLYIRCRKTTDYDRKFLKRLSSTRSGKTSFLPSADEGTNNRDVFGLPKSLQQALQPSMGKNIPKFLRKDSKMEGGVKKYKIRPFADPESPSKTEWMTKEEIHAESLKPSRRWLDLSSGNLGKVYVEVIGCDGLPNKDTASIGSDNVSDPFVLLVFEDSFVKTDVINDCLSPRWMPWMQRAFMFRMMHSSSNLYVGVFDHDSGPISANHELCGRISIDLTACRPNTDYLLNYNLYEDSIRLQREPQGTITLRLRIEYYDEKEMLLSNLQLLSPVFVSVKDKPDFLAINQTVYGKEDMKRFSMQTIQFYLQELGSLTVIKYFLVDGIESLLFWRGQVPIFGIYLPIHSLVLFLSAIILAERPTLFPSFYFFGISYLLLSVQFWKNAVPNPWIRTRRFDDIVRTLIFGESSLGPEIIAAHENEEQSIQYQTKMQARLKEAEEKDENRKQEYLAMLAEHEKLMAEETGQLAESTANTDISTEQGGGLGDALNPINIMKPFLYPVQQYLRLTCRWIRFGKNVLVWEEPYYAFIVVVVSFALGIVFLLVPWNFLIRWITRIVAWGILGPHMKLVDIFYYQHFVETEEDIRNKNQAQLDAQLEIAKAAASDARIQEENALKLKDMKSELFGKYLTEIPLLRFDRFYDVPNHTSVAKPYVPPQTTTRAISERVPGQQLVGDMIPKLVWNTAEEADNNNGSKQQLPQPTDLSEKKNK